MFHVATFGSDNTAFVERIIGNHNESTSTTLEGARILAMADAIKLITREHFNFDGVYGPSDGDDCLEGIRLKRLGRRLIVGIWEE